MLSELQICDSSDSISRGHSAHPGEQGLQVLPLEELHPLGQCGLLVVVPVQPQQMDRSRHGLQQDRAPESYRRFTGFLVIAQRGEVAGETRRDYESAQNCHYVSIIIIYI
jgi:hypothetical protein